MHPPHLKPSPTFPLPSSSAPWITRHFNEHWVLEFDTAGHCGWLLFVWHLYITGIKPIFFYSNTIYQLNLTVYFEIEI